MVQQLDLLKKMYQIITGFVKENVPNNNKVLYLQVCIGTMQTYQKQIIFDERYKDMDSKDPFYDIIQILKSKE